MSNQHISVFLVLFVFLLAVVMVLSKFRNDRPILSSILSEAAMVLSVGMVAGFFIHLVIGPRSVQQEMNQDDDDQYFEDDQAVAEDDSVTSEDLAALLSFSPEIFFIALLPPIIFNSGLRIGPLFFRHIQPILVSSLWRLISLFSLSDNCEVLTFLFKKSSSYLLLLVQPSMLLLSHSFYSF